MLGALLLSSVVNSSPGKSAIPLWKKNAWQSSGPWTPEILSLGKGILYWKQIIKLYCGSKE